MVWVIIMKAKILKVLCAAVIAVMFSFVLLLMGRGLVGNLIGVNENFYLKYYYDIVNFDGVEGRVNAIPDSLVIFNLQKYRNRQDIAQILDKVYSYNPSVIGLDVFFTDNPDIQDSVNQDLISVLRKVQDKLLVPCNYCSDSQGVVYTKYPFFHNQDGLDGITYVSPLAHDFYGYYDIDDSSINNRNQDSPVLPRMGYEVARRSGMSLRKYNRDFYINYSKKSLPQVILEDSTEIRQSTIEGQIVLIGDMSEIKDMTRLPFRFGDKEEISGIEDIAYSVMSLLENAYLQGGDRSRFIGFRDWPKWISLLLAFAIAVAFCLIHDYYNQHKEKSIGKGKASAIVSTLLQPFLFIAAEGLVVAICYLITFITGSIPDLFISMIAIALVGISNDLTSILFSKK